MTRKEWTRLCTEALNGDAGAQWQVGAWLEDGVADSAGHMLAYRDVRAAVRWYRQSAVAGDACGQNNLGVCLSAGCGVRRDDEEALHWFRRAHRQGEPCAANNIAKVYEGRGNHRRAMLWYRRAIACGDGDALVELGRGYYRGIGVRRNPKQAIHCFRKAIRSRMITEAGREDAMYHMGLAFYEGRGVRRSNSRAMRWLSQANRDDDHIGARCLIAIIAEEQKHRN